MKNINFLTRWGGKETSNSWKRVTQVSLTLVTLLIFTCAHTWGAVDFTAEQIVNSSGAGTTTSGISVSSAYTSTTKKKLCALQSSVASVSIASSANDKYNTYYIQVQAPANCTISAMSIKERANGTTATTCGAIYWTGVAGTTIGSSEAFSVPSNGSRDCDGSTALTVPSNTRTIRLYRGPKIKDGAFDSKGTAVGGTSTMNVFGLSVTAVGPVTHTLTNVTKSSGATTATLGSAYSASYTASDGYTLPSTITVTINGSAATSGTDYDWNSSTGAFSVPAAKVNGAIVVTIAGEAAAAGSTWYVKGGWNDWGTTDNLTGSGTELSATVNITTAGSYEFKIWNSDGDTWYGNTGNIGCNVSGWIFSAGESANCKFFASETGNYTFTFNTSTKALSVTYPTAQGKYYYKNSNSWGAVAVYRYVGGINNGWPGTQVVETETVCGETYYFTYADPGTTLIFNNDNGGSQTGDMAASGNAGKYVAGTGSSWTAFPTYTVTYNKNGDGAGGAGSVTGNVPTDGSSPYACGSTVTVLGNTGSLALDGHNFVGWNTAANGSGASYVADGTFTISANTTLYAQWEAAKYTVTYDVNGEGSVTPTSATQASSGASVTLPTPTWSGYTFEGWYNDGTKIDNASYTPTADITLYAHWTDNISGKVFSFIDNNYGDKFKAFDLSDWVTGSKTGRSKTYTNGDGVEYSVSNGCWDNKSNAISSLAKFKGGTSTMSVVIPTGKIATVKISYGAYSTSNKLTVGGDEKTAPSTALTDGMTNAQVFAALKEISLSNQTGTLTLGSSSGNIYIGRVSAVITGYTVSYAAGTYGSGSLDSGTKTAGSSFTLSSSSSAFTRSGYVYDGWSINENGSTKDYDLGGSYTTDAAITLYPHWVADCVAPTTVDVAATVNSVAGFQFYPGDAIELTATPTGSPAGSPVTYQWAKGGVDILDATSSTYSVASATTADAGKYTCTISYGLCSTTSSNFELKCMQFYLKNSSGEDISNHALEKVDATHATLSLSLTGGTTYKFRVTDGCGDWYGNTGEMTSSNCTNWAMDADADCRVTTSSKSATYTFNFDFTDGILGSEMKVSVVYPSGDQPAGKIIYWDNSVLNWEEGKQWYRIGKNGHNNKTQMTLVSGTANLYKITTTEYNGFEYWHIANNDGNGDGNIFWTKGDEAHAITAAMGFEGSPVTADAVTFTPTSSHATGSSSDNDNCEFYEYSQQNGMKTDRVTISDYSNGTITVNYTNTSDEAATLTSGSANLAHTVILTSITAVADEGYDASAITINGGAYSANYVVTGATTVAASFTPHVYSITLNKGDYGAADQSATVAYLAGELTSITHVTPNTGYTLTGYYDGETKVLNADGTFASANVTGYITDSKWTKTSDATLTAKWTPNSYTLTWDLAGGTTTSAGTGIASGVSSNTTTSQAFGTALTAPTVTKANYDFSAWSPSVASTMPAANTTYTATWTAQTHDVSFSLTNAAYSSGTDAGEDVATYGTNYSVTFAADDGFVFPSDITVQIGGVTKTKDTHYTWDASTGTLVVTGSYITGDIAISFAAIEEVYTVEYAGSGNTGGTVPTDKTAYHPGDEVTVLGKNTLSKSGYTFMGWQDANSHFYVEGDKFNITGNTTLTAVWDGGSTAFYHGSITIKTGALTPGSTGSHKGFFTNTSGTIATSSAISLTSTPGEGGYYYESTTLSDAALSNSSNWNASSTSKRTIRSFKYKSGDTYTLALGSYVATSIKFYGYNGSASRTMTVGGVSWTCSSTKNVFDTHNFTKSGNFTGNVSITQDGDFYGVLVVTCISYTGKKVTFNKGSGPSTVSGLPTDRYVPSGSKIAEPSTDPSAANYIFNGWVTTSDGTTLFDFANTTITTDKTIYAKWTAKASPGSGTVSGTTSICSGSNTNVTLSASVSGASYQLYKDNVAFGVAKVGTGSALTWSVSEAGVYTVKAVETATHASGNMSGSATISIYTALSKTTDPTSSQNATVGVGCALSGLTYAGNANVAFQWQSCDKDDASGTNTNISDGGAYSNCTTSAMTFTPASTGTYYFRCVVSDDCGSSFNTSVVTVTAKAAPTIYSLSGEPTAICSDATATLTLSGSDDGVTYKLYKGGVDQSDDKVGDGNEITWTVSAAGPYTVKTVADATYAEATMSGTVTISITTATSITTQPATSPTGHDGVSVTLGSGMAVAGASISYKWYSYTSSDGEGEAVIAGATSPTYAVTKSTGTYYYKVEVIGTCGSVKSDMITLTVDNKHYLTYSANSGSGAPSGGYYAPSASVTLSSTMPTRSGYVFLGWNTNSSGTGDMYQPGATYTMPSSAVTLYAAWASPCFQFSKGTKGTEPTDGFVMTPENINSSAFQGGATLSGGNMTNTSGATLSINASNGFVMTKSARELTLTLTSGMFQEGTVIELEGYTNKNSTVYTYGFSVSGNAATPLKTATASSYDSFKQRYVVAASDGIEGTSSCTVTMNASASGSQTYLSAIYIGGCMSCTTITPSLTYSKTTIWMDDADLTATPSLDKDGSTGTVSYELTSATPSGCVTLNTTTGVVTAVKRGTATITATIETDGTHCGKSVSCTITVKDLECGNTTIAKATRSGTSASYSGVEGGSALVNNLDGSNYKLKSGGYVGVQLPSTLSFEAGDIVRIDLTIGDWWNGVSAEELPVVVYADNTGTNEIYRTDNFTKQTAQVVEFEVTSSMLTALATKQVTIYRRSSTETQNHVVNSVEVKRYACPEGVKEFDAASNSNWGTTANWIGTAGHGAALPTSSDRVVISKPVAVNVTTAAAKNVLINQYSGATGKLTINSDAVLQVVGTIQKTTTGTTRVATAVSDVVIECSKTSQGALIFDQPSSGSLQTKGTVNFYTRSYRDGTSKKLQWQYVGYPFISGTDEDYDGYYINKYSETQGKWIVMRDQGDRSIAAWEGLAIAGDGEGGAQLQGTFAPTTNQSITLSKTTGKGGGENLVGNSWTAPIQLADMSASDFGDATATVYIFNTGRFKKDGTEGSSTESGTTDHTVGQWMTIPISSAASGVWAGMKVIPAFQAFEVITSSATTLSLNYANHVRSASNTMNAELHAPARRGVKASEVDGYRIRVADSLTQTDMYLFEDMSFTTGFDNGWEGYYMPCDGRSAQLYAQATLGKMAVAALPDLEGTLLGFKPGKSSEYTFSFGTNAGGYYLNDLKTQTSTLIEEGETYTFTWENGDSVNRFMISATPFAGMPSGLDEISGKADKVQKVIYKDHVYIIRGGRIFDAVGGLVK